MKYFNDDQLSNYEDILKKYSPACNSCCKCKEYKKNDKYKYKKDDYCKRCEDDSSTKMTNQMLMNILPFI